MSEGRRAVRGWRVMAKRAARRMRPDTWRVPALLAAALALGLTACDRTPGGGPAPRPDAGGGRPFPELAQIADVVAETRAILPRIPADVKPAPLVPADAAPPPLRLVLVGDGRLLRPSAFPHLPQRLHVALYLDERDPPGGRLRIRDEHGSADWPILDGYTSGQRDGAFTYVFRVRDGEARLRYFVLLGVPFQSGERSYRAFEGYLIRPAGGGAVTAEGAIYPVDFGYRQPEPPPPLATAEALGMRIGRLRERFAQWEALRKRLADLETARRSLRETQVPPEQAGQQRADLADFARRIAEAEAQRDDTAAGLRSELLAVYHQRQALAEAWRVFAESNGYRWRTPTERRAAYVPLQTLRAAYPGLERIYDALGGPEDAALRAARREMEQAVLREQEQAPVGE